MMHDPDFWNQPEIAGTNNCYSYAINRPFIRREHPLIFNTSPVLTCKSMAVFMAEDGVIEPNPRNNCPTGYHKIYLALDNDKNFHLYRQDGNGEWYHKRGNAISIKDADGEKIIHPENSNRTFKKLYGLLKDDYSTSCGVFCAKD
jgi:hypothetical protein